MKKNSFIITLLLLGGLFYSCQKEDTESAVTSGELTFAPVIKEMSSTGNRAIGDDFFVTGSDILVTITSSKTGTTEQNFTYTYGANRIFKGNPGYYFSLDDSYITSLTAKWPAEDIRNQGLITDQRVLADYKSADWMSGGVSSEANGIVPTDAPVPLVFSRENVLLDFELVGQNTTGLNIESLLIELQSSDNEGAKAFWAYCGNPNGHAELIMHAGSRILSPDNYLIGRIRVTGQPTDYTVIFPKTDLTLEAGHRYLVTLTPQGYFMDPYVYIAGFEDGEGGIAIPFQQPTPDLDGNFVIETPVQLVTMSYLVRHYDNPSPFNWSTRTYIIADGFAMTEEYANEYIPIPASIFTGTIQSTDGQPLTEIPYGDDSVLQLFDNNN